MELVCYMDVVLSGGASALWLAENEGAKFWLNVLTELKKLGLNDILIT